MTNDDLGVVETTFTFDQYTVGLLQMTVERRIMLLRDTITMVRNMLTAAKRGKNKILVEQYTANLAAIEDELSALTHTRLLLG